MQTKTKIRIFALLGIVSIFLAGTCAWTYTLQYGTDQNGAGVFVKWNATAAASYTVPVSMNLSFGAPSSFNNPDIVKAVILHVENEWNSTMKANGVPLQVSDAGQTQIKDGACDGVNLITFTNSNANYAPPPGVLALTTALYSQNVGAAVLVAGTCGPKDIPVAFAGQIVDADIAFNTSVAFSVDARWTAGTAASLANDIEGTLLHEMGHLLGLYHSGTHTSVMVPAAQQAFPSRDLMPDDIAGIVAAYGLNPQGGAITGKVTDPAGTAIWGALVQLTDANGVSYVSGLTDSTGTFAMQGFAPGTYTIGVRSLAYPFQPVTPTFSSQFASKFTNFQTKILPGTFTVVKGQTLTVPTVQVLVPQTAVFQQIVVGSTVATQNGTSTSLAQGNVESVRRGGTYTLCAQGPNLLPELTVSVPGVTYGSATVAGSTGCFGNGIMSRSVTIPATTAPGNYNVSTTNDFLPGNLVVNTNPTVGAGGIVDGAAFSKAAGSTNHIAQGSIISLFGTDLGLQDNFVTEFPVPTEMGGVSVRIGDRLAPLYYVGKGQINAMVPYEVSGSVGVRVEVGDNSIFDYGNINVVASAPRIFIQGAQDSTGGGVGAIQNGSKGNVQVSATNPASVGDVLVIYCEGLGQTSPPAPTGIAVPASISNGAAQIAGNLTVTIGGQNAPVAYKGVAPGFTGLNQVNATIPAGVQPGNAVQVIITDASGNKSNVATIVVK